MNIVHDVGIIVERYLYQNLGETFYTTSRSLKTMRNSIYARACLALALWTSLAHALSSPLGPVVDLGYAAYAGNATSPTGEANSSVVFFGGLPFAQAPIGNLRFRAPQPLNESAAGNGTVVDARNFAAPCVQQPAALGVGSEGTFVFVR